MVASWTPTGTGAQQGLDGSSVITALTKPVGRDIHTGLVPHVFFANHKPRRDSRACLPLGVACQQTKVNAAMKEPTNEG